MRGWTNGRLLLLAGAIAGSMLIVAVTGSNTIADVPRVEDETQPISADTVKPAECEGLTLTSTVTGSGAVAGTAGNDLIQGSAGPDVIDGVAGDDCIQGLGGDDTITGGPGTEVCIGGPGNDTFILCETAIQ